MNTTTTQAPSSRLAGWISQAESLGLTVEVTDTSRSSVQQWSVTIHRQPVEVANALDAYNNLRGIQLIATRATDGSRWSHVAYTTGLSHCQIKKLAVVPYAIKVLAT